VLPGIRISKDDRECLVISAPHLSDETFITNDLVELVSDKSFFWLGRVDNVVNSGAIKLIPEKIEAAIAPLIKENFFVCGIPDNVLGEKLVLCIEDSTWDISAAEKLMNQINTLKDLSSYEVPKKICFLSSFVLTKSEKLNRRESIKKLINS
jgi:O-succinylbenzoic acid--CoA ligase